MTAASLVNFHTVGPTTTLRRDQQGYHLAPEQRLINHKTLPRQNKIKSTQCTGVVPLEFEAHVFSESLLSDSAYVISFPHSLAGAMI
jgi:hypothetical protein